MANFTLAAFRTWGQRLHGSRDKESWERLFAPGPNLWRGPGLHLQLHRALLEGVKEASAGSPNIAPAKPAELWQRIESALQKSNPELRAALNAGAGAQDLTRLAQTVGKELPEDFKAAYGIHDGQQGGGDLIPAIVENEEGYFLMPTKAIISEWKSWKRLVDNGEFKGKESAP